MPSDKYNVDICDPHVNITFPWSKIVPFWLLFKSKIGPNVACYFSTKQTLFNLESWTLSASQTLSLHFAFPFKIKLSHHSFIHTFIHKPLSLSLSHPNRFTSLQSRLLWFVFNFIFFLSFSEFPITTIPKRNSFCFSLFLQLSSLIKQLDLIKA